MQWLSWFNRTFGGLRFSAPQTAMVGGAEGVSVAHPIETPATENASPTPELGSMANDMKEAISRYAADNSADIDVEEKEGVNGFDDAPIVRLANTIIQQAIKERASDIHLEPDPSHVRVRFRIDGILHEAMPMPKYLQMPLTGRYKVLSQIDLATHRGLPQEGFLPIRYRNEDYNVRVNSQPTMNGDYLTLRINSNARIQGGLEKLGFTPKIQAELERLLYRQCGLFLITAPSGSGATTTLYGLLNYLDTVGVHISTVEEHVSYTIYGATQIVVDGKGSTTMVSAIRANCAQGTDVLGVGEITDKRTARAVLDAAGSRLVIATMRGTDALSSLVRLADMGIDEGVIAETVLGVLSQRLVRRICSECKQSVEIEAKELRYFGYSPPALDSKETISSGTGCPVCRHSGFQGQLGLYHLLDGNSVLMQMFADKEPMSRLRAEFEGSKASQGLQEDGLQRILAQLTTPNEVYRVCHH